LKAGTAATLFVDNSDVAAMNKLASSHAAVASAPGDEQCRSERIIEHQRKKPLGILHHTHNVSVDPKRWSKQ
jgi:hypothetical protein